MKQLMTGYIKTCKQYIATAKGKHDVLDYARAVVVILFVCIVVLFVICYVVPPGVIK
ncbi:hypothetical protein [Anaerovibrio sp.]|uniref:hypothetical protein n=1 Tax=Anaerovibrio sp. TaxID=1872532 RepID=UPI0025BA8AB2|nr:hypothetical protein [Anaerovibrio sp.]MBR2142562.1 hypothetical protein [Anaerovibrio sp.]